MKLGVLLYGVNIQPVYSVEGCITRGFVCFLTTKFYLFSIIFKLKSLWQYGEFEALIVMLSGPIYTIWQFIIFLALL